MRLHSPRGCRWLGVSLLGMTALSAPARAQEREQTHASDPSPSTRTADTQSRPAPGLLGDIGGVRPLLRERGIELTMRYASESAYNASGGEQHLYRETGQFDIGATADLERLVGLSGRTFQTTITWRRGYDLGAAAKLGVLQQVQEVYGRGQTVRLTQFWYEQRIGSARFKIGRISPGEDFNSFSCHFQKVGLCGSQPGNLAGLLVQLAGKPVVSAVALGPR
jgi:porin